MVIKKSPKHEITPTMKRKSCSSKQQNSATQSALNCCHKSEPADLLLRSGAPTEACITLGIDRDRKFDLMFEQFEFEVEARAAY